jgi:outer membrane protein OmpA-like peptidoglycan-associated protein
MPRLLPLLLVSFAAAAGEKVLIRGVPGSSLVRRAVRVQTTSLPEGEDRRRPLEGRTQRLVWKNPKGKTTQEVYDSYVQQLSVIGFKPIYACAGKDCGAPSPVALLGRVPASPDARYALSQLARPELGDAFAAIQVAPRETTLVLVEVKPSAEERAQVARQAAAAAEKITAQAVVAALSKDGRVALGDILYKPGEAGLRPQAAGVVKEIAKALRQQPALRLHVVGHTDGSGDLRENLALSKQRAAWLVRALVRQGIPGSRLRADGVGPVAPVASNESEEGRSRNRRVELVKQ